MLDQACYIRDETNEEAQKSVEAGKKLLREYIDYLKRSAKNRKIDYYLEDEEEILSWDELLIATSDSIFFLNYPDALQEVNRDLVSVIESLRCTQY